MPLPADFKQLHPETQALMLASVEKGGKGMQDCNTVEEAREVTRVIVGDASKATNYQFKGTMQKHTVSLPDNTVELPLYVYRPQSSPPNPTILAYFHGGGFVVCSTGTHETVVQMLTDSTNCIVVNVEYRLAPENKFPVAINDAAMATRWIMENKEMIGGSKDSRVGVMGDSAGGNLAAMMAREVPDVAFQILMVPVTDLRMQTDSYKRYGEGYLLTATDMEWYAKQFFTCDSERTDPRASPVLYSKFENLPPTLHIAVTHDVLVDEGKAYTEKLKAAGVHTDTLWLEGVIHSYIVFPNVYKEAVNTTMKKIEEFVQSFGR